jgi:hypothetical protein
MSRADDVAAQVREQTMVAKFASTDEDAAEIKRICEVAVAAFLTPSKESASALFELGAVAVVAEAQASRV